ncbi:MAG: gliding motility-associated C-terminal domain-containing protein [Saprospiraceae bacterium]|nr:gliding motility-associated C-terminal domain-containing protein [Saprospiraceae bacterium]
MPVRNLHKESIVRIIILILFVGKLSICAQSNEGTEFWFTFMQHRDQGNKRVCMITSKYNITGQIEMASIGWIQTFNVAANTVQIISIPIEAEILSSEVIEETAVKVNTNLPASVYMHQYNELRSDASLVLPVPSLGNSYYIMSYTTYENRDDHYPSEFAIVGVEDNTEIEILASAATKGGLSRGTSRKIILNKGQTYQVQGRLSSEDLTGSFLNGSKNFAVFSGNRWVQVPNGCGNRDNLLEQMPPIDSWGKAFITVPTKNTSNDIFRILAANNNTQIEIYSKGNVLEQSFTLQQGNWRELRINAYATYIKASEPILVAQYLVGGECNGHNSIGDPAMVLLNSLEQYRDTVTLYNSPFEKITENYINIVLKAQDTSLFQLDGRPLNSFNAKFQTLGPNDEFAYAQIDIQDGPHTLIGGGCGVIAIAYGYGYAESYAYGGGANFTKINNRPIPDGGCLHDTIFFKSGLPENKYTVAWDFGNGNNSTFHEVNQIYDQLGKFQVKLKITNLCLNTVDSITKIIEITLRRDLKSSGDTILCVGKNAFLFASDKAGASFVWTGPNNFKSLEQNPRLQNLQLEDQGIYTVVSTILGCDSYPDSIEIEVIKNPKPELGTDTFFCGDKAFLNLNPGIFYNYLWQDGFTGASYLVTKEGRYHLFVENDFGCIGEDSIYISEKCPVSIYVPNVFSPNGDQINDFFFPVLKYYTAYKLEIFDRWGNLLFISNQPEVGWNGRFNEHTMMPGVYVYVILYEGYDEFGRYVKRKKAGECNLLR